MIEVTETPTTAKPGNASPMVSGVAPGCARSGFDRLWSWFGLSYASWLTLPRSMMHEMPDEWQNKMAELLEQWDETWDSGDLPTPSVTAKKNGKFVKWPHWLLNYRHPTKNILQSLKSTGHNV